MAIDFFLNSIGLFSFVLLLMQPMIGTCQPSPIQSEVRLAGTIIESGSNQPLAGVQVSVRPITSSNGTINFATSRGGEIAQTVSGEAGGFEIVLPREGTFEVSASKENYIPNGPQLDGYSSSRTLVLTSAGGVPDPIVLELAKPGGVSGWIRSLESKKPVAGATVLISHRSRRISFDANIPAGSAVSDAGGQFRVVDLAAGPLRVQIRPPAILLPRVNHLSSPPTMETEAARSLCTVWWDLSQDKNGSRTEWLRGGQTRDLGDLYLPTCRKFKLVVGMEKTSCPSPDAKVSYSIQSLSELERIVASSNCSEWVEVLGLPEAEYSIHAEIRQPDGRRYRAMQNVLISGRNEKITVDLEADRRICGKVVMEQDAEPVPAGLRIAKVQRFGVNLASEPDGVVDSGGRFCREGIGPFAYRTLVKGLPEDYFVKSVEEGPSENGSRIVLGRGAARLKVSVQGNEARGDIGKRARVFLAPWPVAANEIREQLRWSNDPSDGGVYVFRSLKPGEYRVFAANDDSSASLTAESIVGMFQAGDSVKLRPNDFGTVALASVY